MRNFSTLVLTILLFSCTKPMAELKTYKSDLNGNQATAAFQTVPEPFVYCGATCAGEIIKCEGRVTYTSQTQVTATGYHSVNHLNLTAQGETSDGVKLICMGVQNAVVDINSDSYTGHTVVLTRWQTAQNQGTMVWNLVGSFDGAEFTFHVDSIEFKCD